MENCQAKVLEYCTQHRLFASHHRLLLAVSGGIDSMVLLDLMARASRDNQIPAIGLCVHINHQLRGPDANEDEALARSQVQQWNIPFVARQADVTGHARDRRISLETAGRQLRQAYLLELAQQHQCDRILTAHHLDDQAETLIHRLLRGTGFRGLSGIPPMLDLNDRIRLVRPLLCLRRPEILDYARSHKVVWREDCSNRDCRFTRNHIRHRLLPYVQTEARNDVVTELGNLAQATYQWQQQCRRQAQKCWPHMAQISDQGVLLSCPQVGQQPPWIQFSLLQLALEHLQASQRDLTQSHYRQVMAMIAGSPPKKAMTLPGSIQVIYREHRLLLARNAPPNSRLPVTSCELAIPGTTYYGRYRIKATMTNAASISLPMHSNTSECMDLDRLSMPLSVRPRQVGDHFIPLGKRSAQKMGKFLTKAKVKKEVLIVEDQQRIVWVAPIRLSQEVRIRPETQNVVQLELLEET